MSSLEYVNCNLCGGKDSKLKYRINSVDIVRCANCGLMYINPRPSGEIIEKIYNTNYFNNKNFYAVNGNLYGYESYLSEKGDIQRSFSRVIKRLDGYVSVKERLLEIGCAMGFFLELAKNDGWQVYGLEVSKDAAAYAKDSLRLLRRLSLRPLWLPKLRRPLA